MLKFIKAAAVAAFALSATVASAQTKLDGSGASFPAPIYQRWITEYNKANPSVQINYSSVGSGGGIKDVTNKSVAFAGSDAPLSKKERAAIQGEVLHIPTVAGAVVPAFNLPGFNGELHLTGEVIAKIYLGEIKAWNDPAIAGINAGAALPATPITPVWRTDGSGTTFVFTNYLATQSNDFITKIGPGKQVRWPAGVGGKGNEGVTAAIQNLPGALGYIELNYAVDNKVAFAAVKNKAGKFVKATDAAVVAAGAAATKKMTAPAALAVDIWNQDGEAAYPISAFTYILVYKDLGYLGDANKAKELVKFLAWQQSDAASKIATSLTYAPADAAVKAKIAEAINAITFNGQPIAK
ncbi:MAG TPA: phosphate ABC transporter substrate-binding protein PstS [Humisphaera sp.]